MKILKPHKDFGNIMSVNKTIFKFNKIKIMIQEYYSPHFIEINVWCKEAETGAYVLIRWYKIALNRYARAIKKLNKLDSQILKLEAYINTMNKRGIHNER